jgi:hypothetical protein
MSRQLYWRTGVGPPDALFVDANGEVTEGWLGPGEARPAEPVRYVFADVVAAWCSTPDKPVKEATVKKWHTRYETCPQAAAELGLEGSGGIPRLAWAASSQGAFREWRGTLPGQGAKGKPKPGSGRRMKSGPTVKVQVGAEVVGEVLSAFPYRAPVEAGRDTRAAEDAAGGRLLVTGTGGGRVVHARDQADADAAAAAVPGLVFERSGGDSAG